MNFENIQQKNIPKLGFFGDLTDEAIDRLELSFQDLFFQSEDYELEHFEQQFHEEKNIKTILVRMPEAVQKISHKQNFYRIVLQEEIDSDNLKKIKPIRHYVDSNRIFYVQIIFEMN